MNLVAHYPSRPIGDLVERFWQVNDAPTHSHERVLPSGTVELVVNLREDEFRIYEIDDLAHARRFSGAIVSGPFGRAFAIEARQHAGVIGVHFRPGGAFPFFGVATGELANRHVDLETLWGRGAVVMRERLCAASGAPERFRLLEAELARHLSHCIKSHWAVQFALDAFGHAEAPTPIQAVAQGAGLSHRRFIQVFEREVGLTPRLFCRVMRFQRALSGARPATSVNWTRLAFECGYCDQPHLIRDFRLFSGLSPTGCLHAHGDQVKENHVPVAA